MTPLEFKSWFKGFTEAMDDCPSKKQWKRILEMADKIDGTVITQTHWVNHYWPHIQPLYYVAPSAPMIPSRWVTMTTGGLAAQNDINGINTITNTVGGLNADGADFNSTAAMYSMGQAEHISSLQITNVVDTHDRVL